MVEEEEEPKSEIFDKFDASIKDILKERKRPLLVMFYSDPAGEISPNDVEALEKVIQEFLEKKKKSGFTELDLLIQTYGGSANTSYRLIQLIRSYCKRLNVLVATHSYSGGTLIAFGADKIEMGRSATLSPIDVQITRNGTVLALLSIEKYIEFLEHSVRSAKIMEDKNRAYFITELTKELIKEVGASDLGELFRLRGMTILHSEMLLRSYMFKNDSRRDEKIEEIISKFNQKSPTHNFEMDFELVKDSGLNVERLDDKIYILLKNIIDICTQLENCGLVCHFSEDNRIPFFNIFEPEEEVKDKKEK